MKMKKICFILLFSVCAFYSNGQVTWQNLDSLYQPLPASMHVYKSTSGIEGKPNIMYYAIADVKNRNLQFTTDTASRRRLTPSQFYDKNMRPLLVVNCSFFSFATNQNLNLVIKNGKLLSYNQEDIPSKNKELSEFNHCFLGSFGISKKRAADVAWTFTDSAGKRVFASQLPVPCITDSVSKISWPEVNRQTSLVAGHSGKTSSSFKKWKVKTAIGGGPVLVQNGEVKISNNEERKFGGRAALNREPRTAIGYTKDHKIIVWVCEGRSDSAAGLSLIQEAEILKDLGCVEALNLDGGGSSCMLINGKETNTPSSKGVQRPVPSVFLIEKK
jgi:exopolysaccharide biosynthesis protein